MTFLYFVIGFVALMYIPGWLIELHDQYKQKKQELERQRKILADSQDMLFNSSYKIVNEFPTGVKVATFKANIMGLIGKDGNLINGIFYNYISEPHNGVLIVSNNGKSALINELGNYIFSFNNESNIITSITYIGESFYKYQVKKTTKHLTKKEEINTEYYILKSDGNFLYSTPFDNVSSFSDNGYAIVEDEKYISRIDKKGKLDSSYRLPKGKKYRLFKDNIYIVCTNFNIDSLWDCTKGDYIFENCTTILFKDWNVFFCRYHKFEAGPIQPYAFIIDENMKTIIPPKYHSIEISLRRFYLCRYYENNSSECPVHIDVYDRNGNLLFERIDGIRCPRYGNVFWVYRNKKIEIVNNSKIVDIYDSSKGFDYTNHIFSRIRCDWNRSSESLSAEPTKFIVSKAGKFGVVSETNDIIQPFEFDKIEQFKSDYASDQMYLVSKKGKYGLLNNKGKLILETNYKSILYIRGNDVKLDGNVVTLDVNTLNFSHQRETVVSIKTTRASHISEERPVRNVGSKSFTIAKPTNKETESLEVCLDKSALTTQSNESHFEENKQLITEEITSSDQYVKDDDQEKIISLEQGFHLVLAPPGCGKTRILAERVFQAAKRGKSLESMLCLTFTNRAARGMRDRIETTLCDGLSTNKLFVGSLHRYCSNFLYSHKIIAQTSSILDENESNNIILNILQRTETDEELEFEDKEVIQYYYELQHFVYQVRNHHPKELYIDAKDNFYKRAISLCQALGYEYSDNKFIEIYNNIDNIPTPSLQSDFVRKLRISKKYDEYKEKLCVNDFEDLLLKSYDYMKSNPNSYKKYDWIQIDEVQDLNRLQLSIVEFLYERSNNGIILFLGDEQQAIFSFIGAKLSTLEYLKVKCEGNLHHMQSNHRSPKYLLDVYNKYAEQVLGVSHDLLPQAKKKEALNINDLLIKTCQWNKDEFLYVVETALTYPQDERTAILVPFNKDADAISAILDQKNIPHFKVSGKDVFSETAVQLVFAHFNVLCFENNLIAWSRIFKGLKIFSTYSSAREFIYNMQNVMLSPVDFLGSGTCSYVEECCNCYFNEIVIFDTETTGLDIFNDDIVQIAAIRLRNGKIVGDPFNIILHTDKKIPDNLGDIKNPLIEEYNSRPHVDRKRGLLLFLSFVGSTPLVGHNVEYDYNILNYNLKKYCNIENLSELCPKHYDTLKLARLVDPNLKSYKLRDLITSLELRGKNSHLADEDVIATKSLLEYCINRSSSIIELQKHFVNSNFQTIKQFVERYKPIYSHTKGQLYSVCTTSSNSIFVSELIWVYNILINKSIIKALPKFKYIVNYIRQDLIGKDSSTLIEELNKHIIEVNTLKEADLCDSQSIRENLFVSTVHKAKGLEYSNVIISSVVNDVYPHFSNKERNNKYELDLEDARKLYVALTRSKKRICLVYYKQKEVYSKKYSKTYSFDAQESPFISPIRSFFNRTYEQISTYNKIEAKQPIQTLAPSEIVYTEDYISKVEKAIEEYKNIDFVKESKEELLESASTGDVESIYKLAQSYLEEKQEREAFHYFAMASSLGHIKAKFKLAQCYCEAKGTEYNHQKAFALFQELNNQGNNDGAACLSCCLNFGYGCVKNQVRAYQIRSKFVGTQFARGIHMLGTNYESGYAIPKDISKAIVLFKTASELGCVLAFSSLARCYHSINKDTTALFWLRLGEKYDDESCMYRLGLHYYNGWGITQDMKKAKELFKNAADKGNKSAAEKLKTMG